MKYIITEQQLTTATKKFNKENADRGELGHVIEELVLNYFKNRICDVVAIKMKDSDNYIVLVLTPGTYASGTETKISNYIENFIGVNPMVLINHSQDCEDNI
jgi:hypothetical protein